MPQYLLDTNILSDLVRRPRGRVAAKIAAVGSQNIATSIIVAAELRFGAEKKGSAKLAAQLDAVLAALDVLAVDVPTDRRYAVARSQLECAGTPIRGNDLIIASQALALGLTVVTDNEREFSRVQGLATENWLR
jgi:tRNA(fMet)-specific endonuclease VapC